MLPAPGDPPPPEGARPEPPPLADRLTGLLRAAGAQAARAVESRRGVVLAEVGLADGDDVDGLVLLTLGAAVVGRSRGEWLEDLVITLGRTVHVLRECEPAGVVLHARLDPARGDVSTVRRLLASEDLHRVVQAAADAAVDVADTDAATSEPSRPATTHTASVQRAEPAPGGSGSAEPLWPAQDPEETGPMPPVGFSAVPAQRLGALPTPRPRQPPAALPRPASPRPALPRPAQPMPALPSSPRPHAAAGPGAPGGQEPALAVVDGAVAPTRTGDLAVLALPPVAAPPEPAETAETALPRRAPAGSASAARGYLGPEVLRQPWASDVPTMRRVLDALHRLS